MTSMEVILVFCTFPDAEQARQIGTSLVNAKLAACVSLVPGIESIYHWQGKVETSQEVLALFKTTTSCYPEFEQCLIELHPYDVPEILAVSPKAASPAYAQWVGDSTLQR